MKKLLCVLACYMIFSYAVHAEFVGPSLPNQVVQDVNGNEISMMEASGTVYVIAREAGIYTMPDETSEIIHQVVLGTMLTRTSESRNGWTGVTYQINGENKVNGFMQRQILSDSFPMDKCNEKYIALSDSDVLDYPGVKEGKVIGEILEYDEIQCTATINEIWGRILIEDENGMKQTGYVPMAVFQETDAGLSAEIDKEMKAGVLSASEGEGVFADALDGVQEMLEGEMEADPGIQVGKPLSASSEATLTKLGVFVITHYCPCSICCGPWANGITSTGVTAVTNRTVAVDPTVIPYGSKLVINGQVYVAEDCGGAIKGNRIDIYVGSHAEGNQRGKYATDVYLLKQ